jgi:hypothetical protein
MIQIQFPTLKFLPTVQCDTIQEAIQLLRELGDEFPKISIAKEPPKREWTAPTIHKWRDLLLLVLPHLPQHFKFNDLLTELKARPPFHLKISETRIRRALKTLVRQNRITSTGMDEYYIP